MNVALYKRILAERRRWIVPIVAALVVNLVAYAVWVYPLRGQVQEAERRDQVARQTLATAQRDQQAAQGMLVGKDQAASDLKTFYRDVLPANLSGARRITYVRLSKLAQESNLRFQGCVWVLKVARESTLR